MGNDGAEALARALEKNTKLEALVLWNNKISDKGADSLLRALDTNLRLSKVTNPDDFPRARFGPQANL